MRVGLQQTYCLLSASEQKVSPPVQAGKLCSGNNKTSKGRERHDDGQRRRIWRPCSGIVGIQ